MAADQVVTVVEDSISIIESAPQGPPGPSAFISSDANNRLTHGSDAGLFVLDDLSPDPLAYYILSKA
jgi:hypothetical protein